MPAIEILDQTLDYRWDGPDEGPVLVLSNSLGTDYAMWSPQIEPFSKSHRILRYQTRGHRGNSLTAGPYSIAQLASDILGLLDRLSIDRFSFCGLSMGGMIGMRLGEIANDRLNKLILCNTSAWIGSPDPWNSRIETIRKSGMNSISETILKRWFTAPFHEQHPDVIVEFQTMIEATPVEGYAACCAAIRDMDQRAILPHIRAKTLVIGGTYDVATPPSMSQDIAASIPNAMYLELSGAHLTNVEAAAVFNESILNFISDSTTL